MEATCQHVYVVKVRAQLDPALLLPSERRYSALTVAGLAVGHALLGGVALLLGALSWNPAEGWWLGHMGAGLWLGLAALQASVCGVLAWRRWYEDCYIAWFFRSSLLAAVVAGAGLLLTTAGLVHLHENVLSAPFDHAVHAHTPPPPAFDGEPSWLDLADSNSSTISSGGVFSDLVRDHDIDLVAADSTHNEDLVAHNASAEPFSNELEWSVLRWVPVAPGASAQVRSIVGANVLVACFLELLWSLLSARLAWRGMQVTDAEPGRTGAPAPTPAPTPHERGAADGKVDVDGAEVECKEGCKKAKHTATSPRGRRRAPDLPVRLPLDHEPKAAVGDGQA